MERITDNYARSYYEMFLTALILCLSPYKVLGFVIPFICIFWFLMRSKSGLSFKRFILINFAWCLLLIFYNLYSPHIGLDFNISNAFLSYLNYSALFFILVFPSGIISQKYNYEKYARFSLYVILIEGCIGILQRILVVVLGRHSTGDVVEGTINPFSFLYGHSGFGNQYFAINMIFFLIFCFPYVYYKKKRWIFFYLIGFLALVLASVGHVFYSLLLAILVTYLIFEGWKLLVNLRKVLVLFSVVSFMLFALAKLDAGVFNASQRQLKMFLAVETPKAEAAEIVFTKLIREYPTIHLVGLGPAQYSSRAGTIASGTYYNLSAYFLKLPFLDMEMTIPFKKYVLKPWLHVQLSLETYGNSTMYRPFFSLLSVYVEFGGLALLLLLLLIIQQLRFLKAKYRSFERSADGKTVKQIALSCSTAILFLFFIGFYENYFETSQGIFSGILLILVMRALVRSHHPIMAPSGAGKQEMTLK